MTTEGTTRDRLYAEAADTYGAAVGRLARAYEADPDARRDVLQEIHFAVWRSLAAFDGRCSLRTWAYRVAHNAAASHVMRQRRARALVDDSPYKRGPGQTESGPYRTFPRRPRAVRGRLTAQFSLT
jgi:RNA polymerase sigma factor (sigma-70 family)